MRSREESPSAATARSAPLEPQSPSKFPVSGRAALSASGARVPTRGLGVVGRWWRRHRAGGQRNAPAGARTSGAGRTVEVGGGGGGPGQLSRPSSPLRMAAAAGSRYHLGTDPGHAPGIPEPRTLAPSGSTWELPRNREGGALVQATQDIPLQVDMSMALRRVRISDKYSKSYFSLLQAASVASKFPPRARRPQAGSRAPLLARSSPGRPAAGRTLSFLHRRPLARPPLPPAPLAGPPFSSGPGQRCRGTVRRSGWCEDVSRAGEERRWDLNQPVGGGGAAPYLPTPHPADQMLPASASRKCISFV